MICPACGAKNREGARFCRSCGRPIDKAEYQDEQPQEQSPGVPEADTQQAEVEPVEEPPEDVAGEEPAAEHEVSDVPAEELPADSEQEPAHLEEPVAADAEAGEEAASASVAEQASESESPDEAGVAHEIEPKPPAPTKGHAAGDEQEEPEAEAVSESAEMEMEMEPEIDEDDLAGAFWREEKEPLTPTTPGTLIADRYLVLEVLDAGQDEVLYLTRDLQHCWQCGAEIDEREVFCPQCGAAQDQPLQSGAGTRLLEVRSPGATAPGELAVSARLTHEGRPFLVLAEPEVKPEPATVAPSAAPTPESIRLIVGQRSDPGQVRELDEDSVLAIHVAPTYQGVTSPVLGLFAVADGMGGHDGGEIASKLALQVLADHALRKVMLTELTGELMLDEDVLVHLRQAVLAANDAVFLARQKRGNDMGTTLTAVLVRDRRLFVAHVGDSRAYRWSGAGLEQLTTDHSVVASMIAHGQVTPDEIYTHPHRSVIYRCIGDQPTVEVDGDLLPLEPGNRIIVCSDGLWEMVRSEGIADVMMQEANPQVACDLLVRLANAAGGEDNISVVVVQVEAA